MPKSLYFSALAILTAAVGVAQGLPSEAMPAIAQSLPGSSSLQRAAELQEAEQLNAQVLQLFQRGQYGAALPLAERSLTLRQRWLEANNLQLSTALNNLATVQQMLGNYDAALSLYRRAVSITEQRRETHTPGYALQLNNLAELYRVRGDYAQSEALHQQAIALRQRLLGNRAPDLATSFNNLAELYRSQGNWEQAEALYQRALAILQQAHGEDLRRAAVINNLALLYQRQQRYAQAAPLLQQVITIAERSLGTQHPHYAAALNNLALFYDNQGDYERARPLYERALAIASARLGATHPVVAQALVNLATVYRSQGRYDESERWMRRALSIREQSLGPHHPDVADSLHRLSLLFWAQGRVDEAIAFQSRSSEIAERNLSLILKGGSEARKRAYMATLSEITDATLSLHLQHAPRKPEAAQLALTTILQRKGRVLDALTDNQRGLWQHLGEGDRKLLEDLSKARSQLANLVFGGLQHLSVEEYKQQVTALEATIQQLENDLGNRSASFRTASQAITLAAVQQHIPADTALVELVQYRPVKRAGTQDWDAPRYAAYVLRSQGSPQWVDLGPVETLDGTIRAFQRTVRDRRNLAPFRQASRALDAQLMQPIRPLLGNAEKLLISPDGQLNLIPFAALVDEQGRYLIERYSLTFLTSGRDLLRLQDRIPNRNRSLIVANPDFGPSSTATPSRSLSDLDRLQFGPLPGTAEEARAIASLLPNATVLTGAQATETALKQAQAPRILHVATHGFFLSNSHPATQPETTPLSNPLLRSGLALSGFNPRRSDREDGVLTALEAAGLNLQGTQLVILSACETGLGEVANGEGVYGLRRALVMAGSESQLISLWRVDDFGTRDLMTRYYDRLFRGESRSEALRQTQLQLLNTPQYQHPYYWAVFIFSGDWRNLDG